MPSHDIQQPNYPVVEIVLNSIVNWVNKYRNSTGFGNELGQCSPNEVRQIAKDLGMSATQLRELVRKGPGAADLLQKMLLALKVDPKIIARTNPLIMRDLQWLCVNCDEKKRCGHEIAKGTAAAHFREFCPNAVTLDDLFNQKDQPELRPSTH